MTSGAVAMMGVVGARSARTGAPTRWTTSSPILNFSMVRERNILVPERECSS
jgi:hypothetical protein